MKLRTHSFILNVPSSPPWHKNNYLTRITKGSGLEYRLGKAHSGPPSWTRHIANRYCRLDQGQGQLLLVAPSNGYFGILIYTSCINLLLFNTSPQHFCSIVCPIRGWCFFKFYVKFQIFYLSKPCIYLLTCK